MSKKENRRRVYVISSAHFFHDVFSAFLAPVLPLIISNMQISMSLAGLLDVVRRIPSLFNPLIGLIADRTDIKYMLILTPAITGISMSFIGLAPNYISLVILLFVAGLSAAFFHVSSPVLINLFSGNKTARGMGYYMFGGELARTIGPLIIVAAISQWGLEGSFRVLPLAFIATVFLYFYLRDIKYVPVDKAAEKRIKSPLDTKKFKRIFLAIGGFLFFNATMKAFLTIYLAVYMVEKGASIWLAGIAISVFQLAGAAGSFLSGYISEKINYKATLLLSAILSPLFMAAFLLFPEYPFVFLVLIGMSLFLTTPVIMSIVQEQGQKRPAFYNSIYMTISFVVSSLMVLIAGVLSDSFGLDNAMKISVVMAIFSIIFVFLFPQRKES